MQLPAPSTEQQEAITAIQSGKCVTINAVAGSGKTTTMLQIASNLSPNRHATILTYNRTLKDECREKILRLNNTSLNRNVQCYTIHGFVSKLVGEIVSDDNKLNNVVQRWDEEDQRGGDDYIDPSFFQLDLLMLDEAQDLRPSFYKAICHIMKKSQMAAKAQQRKKRRVMSNICHQEEQTTSGSLQMCIVGDPKQMLYDFKTYGRDKATSQYMKEPQKYWGAYTTREWVQTKLSTSYRLTPNIAAFVNTIWGTSIKGGNTSSPNLPVEYVCRYPYPQKNGNEGTTDRTRLPTSFFSDLIDEYGPENVMFLAQSVKSEACPIRVHVNELMKQKNSVTRKQKYNFHIKESVRGFEGNTDTKNKVRVWTFCGSKGCEAKVVVIFNFDFRNPGWISSLNQVGVALSRATARLIVIHGMSYVEHELWPNHYYPMLGDQQEGMNHVLNFHDDTGDDNERCHYDVPSLPSSQESFSDVIKLRSDLTQRAMNDLSRRGIICLDKNGGCLPTHSKSQINSLQKAVYGASDFSYFASSEEERFLYNYGTWIKESGVKDRIQYNSDIKFESTTEDVSALYGEAVVYSLQWNRQGYCPNIETVVHDGILRFERFTYYSQETVCQQFKRRKCEPLSDEHEIVFCKRFGTGGGGGKNKKGLRGDDLVRFLNSGLVKLRKKRKVEGRTIYFPVKAALEGVGEDKLMSAFLREIKSIYEKPAKCSAEWIYLANAVMAFGQYHDKWNQVGTDPKSYDTWVESDPFISAVDRLLTLMQNVELSGMGKTNKGSAEKGFGDDGKGGDFERDMLFEFSESIGSSTDRNATLEVVGVAGICDWVGEGLVSSNGHAVDLLEIKFVHELGNVNRLQVLVYCALLPLERCKSCSGMLFNSRTGELEICSIEVSKAKEFLSDITQFKLNGVRNGDQSAKEHIQEE